MVGLKIVQVKFAMAQLCLLFENLLYFRLYMQIKLYNENRRCSIAYNIHGASPIMCFLFKYYVFFTPLVCFCYMNEWKISKQIDTKLFWLITALKYPICF